MTREQLKQALVEAIQREHGCSQPGVGETIVAELERLLQVELPR